MNVSLLDVNVLVPLLWPPHKFHAVTSRWFGRYRAEGWATCPLTQAGFVRLYSQPTVTDLTVGIQKGMELLAANCRATDHVFWPLDRELSDCLPEIRKRLVGHQQLTDAILLDLAIRQGGRLITLDRRVINLLPADSPHLSRIVVISQE